MVGKVRTACFVDGAKNATKDRAPVRSMKAAARIEYRLNDIRGIVSRQRDTALQDHGHKIEYSACSTAKTVGFFHQVHGGHKMGFQHEPDNQSQLHEGRFDCGPASAEKISESIVTLRLRLRRHNE